MSPLFAVRDRLRSRGTATSLLLAAELELSLPVVEDILAHFERRGQVRREVPANGAGCGGRPCGSCTLCNTAPSPVAWFRWCGPGGGPSSLQS